MWSLGILPVLSTLVHSAHAGDHHADAQHLRARNIVQASALASSYDFVIAGGGVAGLVLASRLSEDANTTVLVIEAGGTGADVASSINVPVNCYYESLLNTASDWSYNTVPQPNAGGNSLSWPRGKVLGGSSAINGLYLVRPSQIEVDTWSSMIAPNDNVSAAAWNWDNFFEAMKKSETFTPPNATIQAAGHIEYNSASHGSNGPLQYSYPGYMLPIVGDWAGSLNSVGIPPSPDAAGGQAWGSYVATSSINPSNFTRSYARSAYLDPLPPRPNLAVLTGMTVTRLIFSGNSSTGNLTATQVEYSSGDGAAKKTVNVGKEVILAGGAVGSPQILMLSGVGPQDVLTNAGVDINLVLPGVGHHLQDHLATEIVWATSGATDASIYASKYQSASQDPTTSSAFLSFVNSATAYVNISTLLGPSAVAAFQNKIVAALPSSVTTLVPSKDKTVIAGYEAIYNATANTILTSPVGQVELLLSLTGTAQGGDNSVAIQVALQHPFSQGQIYITSADPFDYPAINPNYLSHFADMQMIREGLKLARTIGQTAPISQVLGKEISPGLTVNTDAEWDTFLANAVTTEYHPSCTCAMLPLSQGGVVDANLQVYGLANVRVADSSVYPMEFAAHLQAPTYGLAEQAADIIRSQYNGVPLPWEPTPTSTSSQSAVTATQSQTSGRGTSSNSGKRSRALVLSAGVTVFLISASALLL